MNDGWEIKWRRPMPQSRYELSFPLPNTAECIIATTNFSMVMEHFAHTRPLPKIHLEYEIRTLFHMIQLIFYFPVIPVVGSRVGYTKTQHTQTHHTGNKDWMPSQIGGMVGGRSLCLPLIGRPNATAEETNSRPWIFSKRTRLVSLP